jgi:hypothetical protein
VCGVCGVCVCVCVDYRPMCSLDQGHPTFPGKGHSRYFWPICWPQAKESQSVIQLT